MRNYPRQIPMNGNDNAARARGMLFTWLLWLMAVVTTSDAFVVRVVSPVQHPQKEQSRCLLYATVGIFFGTSVRNFLQQVSLEVELYHTYCPFFLFSR